MEKEECSNNSRVHVQYVPNYPPHSDIESNVVEGVNVGSETDRKNTLVIKSLDGNYMGFYCPERQMLLKGSKIECPRYVHIKREHHYQLMVDIHVENIQEACEIVLGFIPYPEHRDKYVFLYFHTITLKFYEEREFVYITDVNTPLVKIFPHMFKGHEVSIVTEEGDALTLSFEEVKVIFMDYFKSANVKMIIVRGKDPFDIIRDILSILTNMTCLASGDLTA